MGFLVQQTSYNSSVLFGASEIESICQSVSFGDSFVLNNISFLMDSWTLDPPRDLRFRMELRYSIGDSYYVDFVSSAAAYSDWKLDEDITAYSYNQFEFDRVTVFSPGTYYFCLVSNMRAIYPVRIAIYTGGSFNSKFIKIEKGTGIYRSDCSVAFKIDGVWQHSSVPVISHEASAYITTTIASS